MHRIGTYVLALWLDRPQTIEVGRLGEILFRAGWHLYTGSAHGPGGLRARLARHQRRVGAGKRAHWHADVLRERAVWGGAWARTSGESLECEWAAHLRRLPAAWAGPAGFGSSDCHCPGHLVCIPELPDEAWFVAALGAQRLWLGEEEPADLLQALTTGDDPDREVAALALGRFRSTAVAPLARLLSCPDEGTRWWAARALAEVGVDEAVAPLVVALEDADADVRACAALALGRLGACQAAPALAAHLADKSTFVASVGADALSLLGEAAIPALAGMLSHPSAHTRLLAVRALERTRSQRAAVPLFEVLDDPSYLVRQYALEALESLGMGMVYFSA